MATFNTEIDKTIEQATAILNSLKDKWIPIVNGKHLTRDSTDNCVCCQKWWNIGCDGCPIYEKRDTPYCKGLPIHKLPTLGYAFSSDVQQLQLEADCEMMLFLLDLRTELFERLADEMEEWLENK